MMNNDTKATRIFSVEKFKYPIMILALGVLLLLFTGGNAEKKAENDSPTLSQILACTRGVGECRILVSDKGVVVVCEGADNAKVRLEIIRALSSYTGYSSDKITILKMAE